MPTYEVLCGACGNEFTCYLSITEGLPPCPKCGNKIQASDHPERLRKLISLCSFQLKGSGWARDGYR